MIINTTKMLFLGMVSLIMLLVTLQLWQTDIGRTSFVVTSKGAEVKTGFKVVSARSLIISNNMINPLFPVELQSHGRTRMSSKIQVSKIAGNLRLAQLSDFSLSSYGAPIVGADNVIESSNCRSMGIMRTYKQGRADAYRQYLIDHASDYGLKGEDIALMDMPVLRRHQVVVIRFHPSGFYRNDNPVHLRHVDHHDGHTWHSSATEHYRPERLITCDRVLNDCRIEMEWLLIFV